MKLAVSTLGCPAWSFGEIVHNCHKIGFQALEIRGVGNLMQPKELTMFDEEHARESQQMLMDNQLSICTLGTSIRLSDPGKKEEARKEAEESIDLCRRMSVPSLRVFGDTLVVPESVDLVIQGLDWLSDLASGIQVLLEIHGQFQTIETLQPIMREVTAPNFGIIWDVAHSDEVYQDNWKPFYEVIASRIREIHVKDYHRRMGRQGLCLMGEGDIPWKPILHQLDVDGFDGYYTLEWEKRWHDYLPGPEVAFPQFVQWMRESET